MINRVKRVTALSLSVMLMLNMTATAIPVSAEGESKIYTHDGYTVEYTIKNEWTGNQNIEVKITNTSDEILSDWAVGYNAFGEINGLWNAQIYGHQGTEYILKGADYNCEIEPGQSTNFGYTLTGDSFKIPQNIVNCAERVDITDGYNVENSKGESVISSYSKYIRGRIRDEHPRSKSNLWIVAFGIFYPLRWTVRMLLGKRRKFSIRQTIHSAQKREQLLRKLKLYK